MNEYILNATNPYTYYGILSQYQQAGAFTNQATVQPVASLAYGIGNTTLATVYGYYLNISALDTSTITTGYGYRCYVKADGTITTMTCFGVSSIAGTGTIANIVGLCFPDLDRLSTKTTNVLLGTTTIPTNRWSLYNISLRNNLTAGPTINYAMSKEDDFDGTITWAAALAVGVYWRVTLAGAGAIAQVANARGGIISLTSTIATPSWLDENAQLGWSVQDYPVVYGRFRTLEVANTIKAIGYADTVNGAGNLPYTNSAILITVDTSIGNFFYLTGVVGGARVNSSSGIALDANYHTFMILPKYLPATGAFDGYELWIDGVVTTAVLTAAQCPAVGTMMQCLPAFAGNLGGAVLSTIYVDTVKFSQRRNTGTAA